MNKKYLDIIKIPSSSETYRGGYCNLNDEFKDIIIENVNIIDFESLYPTILVGLYDNGLVGIEKNVIEKLRYFLLNKKILIKEDISLYGEYKIFSNGLYGKIDKKYQKLISDYAYEMMLDIHNNNYSKIIYIDVDSIYYKGNVDISEYTGGLKYSVSNIEYFSIFGRKKYISYNLGQIKKSGYYSGHHQSQTISNIIGNMVEKSRNKKINQIINYDC